MKEINFFVLCTEKLNDADYIENVLPVKIALSSCLQNTILSRLQNTIFS